MRNLFRALSGIVVVSLLISGCSKKQANYYRKVGIDGRYAIVGRYPLTAEEAKGTECYHFVYDDDRRLAKVEHLKKDELQDTPNFGPPVAQVVIRHLEESEERSYLNAEGEPTADHNGIFSYHLKLDKKGHPTSLFNYDKQGRLIEEEVGVAQHLWTLDKSGRRIKSIFLNEKGDRIAHRVDVFEVRWKYDRKGNSIEESCFGKDGQLTDYSPITRWKYDKYGEKIEESRHGMNGKLEAEDLDGYAVMRWQYDEHGNVVEESYYGVIGQVKEDKLSGAAPIRYKHDEQGNKTEESYYGTDGQLKEDKLFGIAMLRYEYDEHGNKVEERYYGTDGQLKEAGSTSVAVIRYEYDEQGSFIEERYYGANGSEKPHIRPHRIEFFEPEIEMPPEFVPYDIAPEPKYWFKPEYPDIAREAGIEGMVILKLLVDTDGSVLAVKILKSVHPALDQAASDAAMDSKFSPAMHRNKPVKVWVSFPVKFRLGED